jgi:hypothetical protein
MSQHMPSPRPGENLMHSSSRSDAPRRRWIVLLPFAIAGLLLGGCADTTRTADPTKIATPPLSPAERLENWAKTDHIALLEHCLAHYKVNRRDFTCRFFKEERIGGSLQPEQGVEVKFREKPFSVAFKWIKNTPIADRMLYVEGKYGGKMLVRPASPLARLVAPTVAKPPDDPEVFKRTLRPVTQFGFRRGMEAAIADYRRAADAGDLKMAGGEYFEVEGRQTLRITRILPDGKDYPSNVTHFYIDTDHLVPVSIVSHGWNDELLSRYVYKDVKFDAGLTDAHFAPEANDLRAPK